MPRFEAKCLKIVFGRGILALLTLLTFVEQSSLAADHSVTQPDIPNDKERSKWIAKGSVADDKRGPFENQSTETATTMDRLGVVKMVAEDYSGALSDFNRAIKLDANDSISHANRALVEYKLKLYRDSIQDCNEVIRLKPSESAAMHVLSAKAKIELEDLQGAIKDLHQAIEMRTTDRNRQTNHQLLENRVDPASMK
jgi:tetratricopeptide (TPR) repeat protein